MHQCPSMPILRRHKLPTAPLLLWPTEGHVSSKRILLGYLYRFGGTPPPSVAICKMKYCI